MHVLWFTARSFRDLCSTTQRALMRGLLNHGLSLTLVNGDFEAPFEHAMFEHVALPIKARRGFQAKTLARSMLSWISHSVDNTARVAVVEWRVATWVAPELERRGIPWLLMDRSPPADRGLFARLQWSSWRKAWKLAKNHNRPGSVVSSAHAEFVSIKTGHAQSVVLEAGVDLARFKPATKHERLTMVYHGRLDRHRGVLAAVMLTHKAVQAGLDVRTVFIGEGDAEAQLRAYSEAHEYIMFHPKTTREQVAELLGSCHVGLLPMPANKVWSLASPLKRGEYLAAGLCVLGIDHEGHRLVEKDVPWMKLVAQHDFLEEGVAYLREVNNQHEAWGKDARAHAEKHLDWQASVEALHEALHGLMRDA